MRDVQTCTFFHCIDQFFIMNYQFFRQQLLIGTEYILSFSYGILSLFTQVLPYMSQQISRELRLSVGQLYHVFLFLQSAVLIVRLLIFFELKQGKEIVNIRVWFQQIFFSVTKSFNFNFQIIYCRLYSHFFTSINSIETKRKLGWFFQSYPYGYNKCFAMIALSTFILLNYLLNCEFVYGIVYL
eukprot:TRINITY_DN8464_c4_g1_i2.p1 TRINITY_DN8464_c4_g1~~TRINITY_DN8464_c4_g1_i2.p1  ORF type:complete len:200 (-),score=-8.16 TRINITY_DN8464_c4_g1_i2:306-857(-)